MIHPDYLGGMAIIATIGSFILVGVFGTSILDNFGPVLRAYLTQKLALSIERQRAELEAKIKLIRGLD